VGTPPTWAPRTTVNGRCDGMMNRVPTNALLLAVAPEVVSRTNRNATPERVAPRSRERRPRRCRRLHRPGGRPPGREPGQFAEPGGSNTAGVIRLSALGGASLVAHRQCAGGHGRGRRGAWGSGAWGFGAWGRGCPGPRAWAAVPAAVPGLPGERGVLTNEIHWLPGGVGSRSRRLRSRWFGRIRATTPRTATVTGPVEPRHPQLRDPGVAAGDWGTVSGAWRSGRGVTSSSVGAGVPDRIGHR